MASIERRMRTRASGRTETTWVVRWRDPDDKQKSKTFVRKVDAERFRDAVAGDLVRGLYIDPDAGKVAFRKYAGQWLTAQTFEEGTHEMVELRLRLHAYPVLGDKFIGEVKPSTIQAWLGGLSGLATTYQKVVYANVSQVFSAAVDDGMIVKNPCRASSVRKPKIVPHKVVPWPADQVLAVERELVDRYALVATLAAGLGLRQGEVFGLSPDDVDFGAGLVSVRRQVKLLGNNRQIFGLPKGRKTRKVPLPDSVAEVIKSHLTRFPPRAVTLPWERSDGDPQTHRLLLTTRERRALNRNYFNPYIWRPALKQVGVEPARENGCHALRHFYASTLLDAGESIKAVSEYLGHADPGFTLRTYTHLMPTSDERTKKAIDSVRGVPHVYPRLA